MANNGLSLKVLLSLQKQQFDAGIKSVQKSLAGLASTIKSIAGIIIGGIGLEYLGTNLKNTAIQLSTVDASLENVSQSTMEYEENLEFLTRISKKYGQSLIVLEGAFGKFRAAAGYAGVEIGEIRDIFEGLTQAAGAYHLTAQQTSNAMIAIEQMFSKGKVTAEELRRQLGNQLPGAFGVMALAAQRAGITVNGTTKELEAAMKEGRILAADVLPHFAQILREITAEANFDSLQASLNRLSTAWAEFVKGTGFGDYLSDVFKGAAKGLNFITDNLKVIKRELISLASVIGAGVIFNKLEQKGTTAVRAIGREVAITDKQMVELATTSVRLETAINNLNSADLAKLGASLTEDKLLAEGLSAEYTTLLLQVREYDAAVAGGMYASQKRTALSQEKLRVDKELEKVGKKNKALIWEQTLGTNALGRAWLGLGTVVKTVGRAIASAFSAIAIGAIVGVITELIQKFIEARKGAESIEDYAKRTAKAASKVGDEIYEQTERGQRLLKYLKEEWEDEKKRATIISEINDLLGNQGDKLLTVKNEYVEIAAAVNEWSKELVRVAKIQGLSGEIGKLTAESAKAAIDIADAQQSADYKAKTRRQYVVAGQPVLGEEILTPEAVALDKKIAEWGKIISKNKRTIEKLEEMIKGYGTTTKKTPSGSPIDSGDTTDRLKKAIDAYQGKVSELQNQLANGAITQDEFTEGMGKLAESSWKTVAGFDKLYERLKVLGPKYEGVAAAIKKGFEDENIRKYNQEVAELQKKFNEIVQSPDAVPGKRDTFRDYKKSESEIKKEDLDIAEDYEKALGKIVEKLLKLKESAGEKWTEEMQKELDTFQAAATIAAQTVSNLDDAAKWAELSEDIKEFSKTLRHEVFDSIKDFATAFDRLIDSIESVGKALEELSGVEIFDKDTFNKIKAVMTILNEIFQTIDTVRSVMEGVEKVKEANLALSKATAAMEAAQQTQTLAGGAETVAVEEIKAAAAKATAKAYAQQAVAAAAAHAATLGGPIGATAAAVETNAALIAAMSSLQAFAKGGIIGGNSFSGDKTLVRANSGEMLLTKGQQKTLFDAINKGSVGSNNNVEFKIRGCDLVGTIKNYESKKRG